MSVDDDGVPDEVTPSFRAQKGSKKPDETVSASKRLTHGMFSMELLDRIAETSLDPGYSARRREEGKHSSTLTRAWILLVCLALAFGTTIAIRNMYAQKNSVPEALTRLNDQIAEKESHLAELEGSLNLLTEAIQEKESTISASSEGDPALELSASIRTVEGPGVIVQIKENVQTGSVSLVSDGDIRAVVNALWSGGAEAITVNGERVGPQTNVRMAGQSILVNLKAIKSPYAVEAIGDSQNLLDAVSDNRAVAALQANSGMSLSVTTSSRLILGPLSISQTWHVEATEEGEGSE